jgi:hypothetical protein
VSMVGISSRTTLIAKMRRLGINPGQSSGLSLLKANAFYSPHRRRRWLRLQFDPDECAIPQLSRSCILESSAGLSRPFGRFWDLYRPFYHSAEFSFAAAE